MRRRTYFGVVVCLLSMWMQTLVPAALAARTAFDPFAVICHHASTGDDGAPSAPIDHSDCEHCLLCHAMLAGLGGAPAPVLPTPERYASAQAAWFLADIERVNDTAGLAGRPRGPPSAA